MPLYINGKEIGNSAGYSYPCDWTHHTGDPVQPSNNDELLETIKTIQTLCEICIRLQELPCTSHLLPSLLEYMQLETQQIVENHCIVE